MKVSLEGQISSDKKMTLFKECNISMSKEDLKEIVKLMRKKSIFFNGCIFYDKTMKK